LLAFWIPLQDATLQNGCLWGIPGSHQGKLYKRSKVDWDDRSSKVENLHEKNYQDEDFLPFEMKRGSLAVFPGRFLHKSLANTSPHSRYAYTWHLKKNSTEWSK
jgi:phytanoyl-CoA hydroxylase